MKGPLALVLMLAIASCTAAGRTTAERLQDGLKNCFDCHDEIQELAGHAEFDCRHCHSGLAAHTTDRKVKPSTRLNLAGCPSCHKDHVRAVSFHPEHPSGAAKGKNMLRAIKARFSLDPPHDTVLCQNCHGSGKNAREGDGIELSFLCLDCHRPGGQGTAMAPKPANPSAIGGGVFPPGAGFQHNFAGPATNARAHAKKPQGETFYRTFVSGTISCASCHNPHRQPGGTTGGHYLRVSLGENDDLCLSCHGELDVRTKGGSSHPLKGFAGVTSMRLHGFPQLSSLRMVFAQKNNRLTCTVCHTPHNAYAFATPTSKTAGNAYIGRAHTDHWLCVQCHRFAPHGNSKGSPAATCKDCHSMHNPGDNAKLIRTTVSFGPSGKGVPVVFTNDTTALSFARPDGTGLCQACHTKTKYFRNYSAARYIVTGPGSGHNEGSLPCVACHSHKVDTSLTAPAVGEPPAFKKKSFTIK